MSPCEGYACPPTHTTPAGEVEVHTVQSEPLPSTGGEIDPFFFLAAVLLIVIGLPLLFGKKATR